MISFVENPVYNLHVTSSSWNALDAPLAHTIISPGWRPQEPRQHTQQRGRGLSVQLCNPCLQPETPNFHIWISNHSSRSILSKLSFTVKEAKRDRLKRTPPLFSKYLRKCVIEKSNQKNNILNLSTWSNLNVIYLNIWFGSISENVWYQLL